MVAKYLLLLVITISCSVGPCWAITSVSYEELQCLTDNIYFEARGEPILGQAMVGHSVINRSKDKRWPSSICKVVYQKSQYSWTANREQEIDDMASYHFINDLAFTLLSNRDSEEATGVTNYLRCDWRDKVDWWKSMTSLGQVGEHCFYRDEIK